MVSFVRNFYEYEKWSLVFYKAPLLNGPVDKASLSDLVPFGQDELILTKHLTKTLYLLFVFDIPPHII